MSVGTGTEISRKVACGLHAEYMVDFLKAPFYEVRSRTQSFH
jgi:hypothetical protein